MFLILLPEGVEIVTSKSVVTSNVFNRNYYYKNKHSFRTKTAPWNDIVL